MYPHESRKVVVFFDLRAYGVPYFVGVANKSKARYCACAWLNLGRIMKL